MKNDGIRLYVRRKCGSGKDIRYILSHFLPSLIVFLIVMTLTFVMIFISSMTEAIDRMIENLGSGSITTSQYVDVSKYKGALIDEVKEADGILYTSNGKSLVHLKGVDIDSYFSPERKDALKLSLSDSSYTNEIIVSSTLASSLSLDKGSRMTLLLYETDNERARPVLVTVSGIYSSGYAELDRYLAFVDISLVDGETSYEILLDKNENVEKVLHSLWNSGVYAVSYKDKYSSLCSNVDQSIMILNVILVFVAVLAAFFSADIAHVYTVRDRRDIALLRLMGMREKNVRVIYRKMTILSVAVSTLLGVLFGSLLSLLSPHIINFVAMKEPEMIEYYISSFTLSFPYSSILIMVALMLLCSSITLRIELWRTRNKELYKEIK